jgi:chromosomal replication initiation ATPase DnaA
VEARLAKLTRQRPQAEAENADRSNPLVAAVRGVICREYAITLLDLLGPSLCPSVVQARQIAMYLCRKLAPMSYPEIARHFGKRNHTTALHACAKVNRLRMTDEKLDLQLMALESEIRSSSVGGK